MRTLFILFTLVMSASAFAQQSHLLPEVPHGSQAISLFDQPLSMPAPNEKVLANLVEAKAKYEADPMDANNIIWYGRRVAYTGDFRRAILIFSEGIRKHPNDARMYRHRGHRYITIREFDRAIEDYEIAATLIEGTEDKIEPDGAPNPAGIPVTSTHSNIYYHLGLAYYLKHDFENSLRVYKMGRDLNLNDDNTSSTTHWIYMNLKRLGRDQEAEEALRHVTADMNIIEVHNYHKLVMFYKGEVPEAEVLNADPNIPAGASITYGVANWFLYNGQQEKAYNLMERFLKTSSWGSFGYIAAEVDLKSREALFSRNVPAEAQAMSFLGEPLYPAKPSERLLNNLAETKAKYDQNPDDVINIIWYGRRVAYTGDYRRAIEIYSDGIKKFPNEARLYRHRGHRYISVREIDRAVADYEMAAELIKGTEDKIEPDGAPNPQGIYLTSTHSNIYYHLGLSYFLRREWQKSYDAFKMGQDIDLNDDNIVSAGHWMYMNLRRLGKEEEAKASLHNIKEDMEIIENMSYHNLTLMYKGIIPAEQLTDVDPNDPSGAAIAFGVANWFLYNGDEERAYDLMERFMDTSAWSAFGFIAAEKELSLR